MMGWRVRLIRRAGPADGWGRGLAADPDDRSGNLRSARSDRGVLMSELAEALDAPQRERPAHVPGLVWIGGEAASAGAICAGPWMTVSLPEGATARR